MDCGAPPCERLGVSSTPAEKVRFTGLDFNPSALQSFEGLVFQEARSLELIHAAAYLRALSFHTYPEGRSEESLKLHRKMKTDDEFRYLKSKVGGLQQGYKRIVILANGKEYVLAGSLDLNQGIVLPGETVRKKTQVVSFNSFLAKRSSPLTFPAPPIKIQSPAPERGRGYISNVCVAPSLRQRGVGKALLQQAQNVAHSWGINSLYVHVVPTNEAAVKLYNKGGFTFEKEDVSVTSRPGQPMRLLLVKTI
uniref:N-acetyltransferase domain-containing protein n=1 Tax=Physcomitrium patens TaxID=3218 RepID=A0A7I4A8V2_PHYPA